MFVVLGLADVGLQSPQHLFLPSVARALAQVGLLAFIPLHSPLISAVSSIRPMACNYVHVVLGYLTLSFHLMICHIATLLI